MVSPTNASTTTLGVDIDGSFGESDGVKDSGLIKRPRTESCDSSISKACREKMRRDRLNDKFIELGTLLEPGKPPNTDKAAVLVDAVSKLTQLRSEAEKLKATNLSLEENLKEMQMEKNELREEKQRLTTEKEKMEQQLKSMNAQPSFTHAAMPTAFAPQGQAAGDKLLPVLGYPGVSMWQFMPPAVYLRPPAA